MRIATIVKDRSEHACICLSSGVITVSTINRLFGHRWPTSLQTIIETEKIDEINHWFGSGGREKLEGLDFPERIVPPVSFAPLLRHPRKIWGIGLNYSAHAQDLSEKAPSEIPASFMKPDTAVIGHGDTIKIPNQSEKTTAEAELGIIVGKTCKNLKREEWLSAVAGFTCVIDMTAEDILRRNPRYLTLSKSFDTFFSFGPHLTTPDEIEDVLELEVATVLNGRVHAKNVVANMTFPPDVLLSFHSGVMTLLPGDVISTGTPGAGQVRHGDVVSCRISGFEPLENPVVDLKT
jgi:2-keto-4-pentenoate hydratase/2-oxohepta-3-ene-1,7-dioic acid hydratase in catechol pathway